MLVFSTVAVLGVIIPVLFYIWSKLLWIELHGILSAVQSIGKEVCVQLEGKTRMFRAFENTQPSNPFSSAMQVSRIMRGLMRWVSHRRSLILAFAIWYVAMIVFAVMNIPLPPFLPSQVANFLVLALSYSVLVQFFWKRHERAVANNANSNP